MAPTPAEVRHRAESGDSVRGKLHSNPSVGALENFVRAVLRLLDDHHHEVGAVVQDCLALNTPHLPALLGSCHEEAPWSRMKHERRNRRKGRAISPEKGILYALVVLDACGVFTHVAVDYWKYNDADIEIDRSTARNRASSARDIARRTVLPKLSDRAGPTVFATLDAWEAYVDGLRPCATDTVELAVPLTILSDSKMLRAIGGFVEELVEKSSEVARSNGSRRGRPDDLASEIVHHHRIHDPNDVNWMAERWDAVRDMIGRSLSAGNLDSLVQTGPILAHFSYVFEGSLPSDERIRVKIAQCIQAQGNDVPAEVALFERIEAHGFVLLEAADFAGLNWVAGDEAFRANEAKIRETIDGLERRNRNPRLAVQAHATLHRLRAHLLLDNARHTEADSMFQRAAQLAATAKNESLQSAVLLDQARNTMRRSDQTHRLQSFENMSKCAEVLAWQDSARPNFLALRRKAG